MGRPNHRVYQIIDANGLPVEVGLCHWDEEPLTHPDEELQWVMGRVVPLGEPVCRLFVRDWIRLIADAEGDANVAPPWLRSPLPRPPKERGRGRGRAIIQTQPDGQEIYYPSVTAASKATGYKRIILHRRLLDGRPDSSGCHWRDAKKCNRTVFVTRAEKSGGSGI